MISTKRIGVMVALAAMAVLVGTTIAFAAPYHAKGAATSHVAFATTNCTNYFPVSYPPNYYCDNSGGGSNGTIPGNTWGTTQATAIRDSNCMYTTSARSLEVWYGEQSGASTYGTNICEGSSVTYQNAECANNSSSGTTGRCVTIWRN